MIKQDRTDLKMSATRGRAIVLVSLCYLWCLRVVAQEDEGECISGFGPVMAPSNYISPRLQVIIPSFQFNDSGRIAALHLAGICAGAEPGGAPADYTGTVQDCINILQVWRPSGGDGFSIAANFTATLAVIYDTAATASVAVDEPIPFSSGDVLGFTPGPDPGLYFVIATTSNQQPASHTYYTFNSFVTELSTTGNGVVASPIISLEVNCGPVNPGASPVPAEMLGGVVGGVVAVVIVVVVLVVLVVAAAITWQVRRKHLHSSRLHLRPKEVIRTYDTVDSTRVGRNAQNEREVPANFRFHDRNVQNEHEIPASSRFHGATNPSVAVYTELNTTRGEVAANLGTFDSAEQHFYDTIDSVPSGAGTHRTVVQRSMPIYGVVPSEEERRKLDWQALSSGYDYPVGFPEDIESLYEMASTEVDTYWEPHSTENGIYSQMSEHKYQEIQLSSVAMASQLGAGEFGEVYRAELQTPYGALDVAVKLVKMGASQEERVKLLQEAAILGQFRHKHIVRLVGVITLGEQSMMLMELLAGGDLRNHLLHLRQQITETTDPALPVTLLKFCRQVAEGLSYLAGKSFVHRDIAARNILLDEEHNCKISDFGMSRDLDYRMYYVTRGGQIPLKWTAPEAILYMKYSTSSDVWSYGMLMYEIWSLGHKPFEDLSPQDVVDTAFQTGYCHPPPPGCPRAVYAIMVDCWHPQHTMRPEAKALHVTLSQTNERSLLAWKTEDKETSPGAAELGAPLEEGTALYQDLQIVYTV